MPDEDKPVTAGELKLSDLPPVEDLTISVPAKNLIKVGKVISIVDVLVVVESVRAMPPLDIDTVLFDVEGEPVGKIFDVFGSIQEPHYSIRFNSGDQIKGREIHKEMAIYFLPQPDRNVTKFAFVEELKKHKGTDASWEHDNEPPETNREFSDDEDEVLAKRGSRSRKRTLTEIKSTN